ncbi:cell filamentation protein [Mycetocola sp. BIGb0189]|nr:cell filamentation protein [Mycetocola sp. BIGb0189]
MGARTHQALRDAESDLATARTIQIQNERLVAATRDFAELCELHRNLFQDVFAWAGVPRQIDFARGTGESFAPYALVERGAKNLFEGLAGEDHLRGLGRGSFIEKLAYYYNELNFLHPFRDGNGRTQRLFWSRVSFDAGWLLDWRPIHGEELNEVSRIAREDDDLGPLLDSLARCVVAR